MQHNMHASTQKINMRQKLYRGIYGDVAKRLGIARTAAYMRYRRGDLVVTKLVLEEALKRQHGHEKESRKIRELLDSLQSNQH